MPVETRKASIEGPGGGKKVATVGGRAVAVNFGLFADQRGMNRGFELRLIRPAVADKDRFGAQDERDTQIGYGHTRSGVGRTYRKDWIESTCRITSRCSRMAT